MEGTSRASNPKRRRSQRRQASYMEVEYSGPSYINLPEDILVKIFLKLSVMSIFVCKSVCKTWNDILSDHSFALLHFGQAKSCPLLRSSGATFSSRLLYLVEPEQGDFDRKLDMCDHEYTKSKCFCHVRVKLDTKLKLPVRNLEKIVNDGDDELSMQNPGGRGGKLRRKDHKYRIVNSCNGLLCLSDPIMNNAIAVCNPVTGEFVDLPKSEIMNSPIIFSNGITCGFGYGPRTNQYKVIRMFSHYNIVGNRLDPALNVVAEVNILGTNTWKNIGPHPHPVNKKFPSYSKGCIFWLNNNSIIVFGVEEERFKSIPLPPLRSSNPNHCNSMGVFGEDIYITEQYANEICIWVKKDFPSGDPNWNRIFSSNLYTGVWKWPRGIYQPLKCLNDGAILMFHSPSNVLIYKDPKKLGYRYLKVRGFEAKLEAIPHIPSFISLKDILCGSNMQVLNVKSRCARLKLHNEKKVVSLVEEEFRYE